MTLVVGDSQVKYLHNCVESFTVLCFSGYKVQQLFEEVREVLPFFERVIFHVGTNNVPCESTLTIVDHYRCFLEQILEVQPDLQVAISSVLPRFVITFRPTSCDDRERVDELNSRAERLNGCLEKLASNVGAVFLDHWSRFKTNGHISRDGLHLTPKGIECLASRFLSAFSLHPAVFSPLPSWLVLDPVEWPPLPVLEPSVTTSVFDVAPTRLGCPISEPAALPRPVRQPPTRLFCPVSEPAVLPPPSFSGKSVSHSYRSFPQSRDVHRKTAQSQYRQQECSSRTSPKRQHKRVRVSKHRHSGSQCSCQGIGSPFFVRNRFALFCDCQPTCSVDREEPSPGTGFVQISKSRPSSRKRFQRIPQERPPEPTPQTMEESATAVPNLCTEAVHVACSFGYISGGGVDNCGVFVGARFNDWQSFSVAFSEWCSSGFHPMSIGKSSKLEGTDTYRSCTYICVHGRRLKQRGTGARSNQRYMTGKGCAVKVKVDFWRFF